MLTQQHIALEAMNLLMTVWFAKWTRIEFSVITKFITRNCNGFWQHFISQNKSFGSWRENRCFIHKADICVKSIYEENQIRGEEKDFLDFVLVFQVCWKNVGQKVTREDDVQWSAILKVAQWSWAVCSCGCH